MIVINFSFLFSDVLTEVFSFECFEKLLITEVVAISTAKHAAMVIVPLIFLDVYKRQA